MYKTFIIFVLTSLCIVHIASAVGEVPTQKVWVTPVGATPGTPIVISAFLYNDQKDTVTYTLEVKAADTNITTTVATIAPGSAKTLTFNWKEPKEQTTVAVSIISALGKNKKDIPLLHGTLGAALVGDKSTAPALPSLDVGASAVDKAKAFVESIRTKQADYFTTLRDSKRSVLGLDPVGTTPTENTDGLQVKRVDNPVDYAILILATTLASFFSHVMLFYAISIIFAFLLIRVFVKMFI
jgi:hypothetical protein